MEDDAGLEGCGGLDGLVGCLGEGEDLGEEGRVVGEGCGAEELPSGISANLGIEGLEQCIPVAVWGAGAGFDCYIGEVGDAHGVGILRLLGGEILQYRGICLRLGIGVLVRDEFRAFGTNDVGVDDRSIVV